MNPITAKRPSAAEVSPLYRVIAKSVDDSQQSLNKGLPDRNVAKRDICAILTTYRPDDLFIDRVARILPQVGMAVIIDDGAFSKNEEKLKNWFSGSDGIIVHHNPINIGLAASLNVGVKIALQKGFAWFLTIDDDSLIASDMVEKMIHALKVIKTQKPIGIIGMSWCDRSINGKTDAHDASGPMYSEKRGIITSGSLFSAETYKTAGPFREEFFIDMVDYDFCLRARAKGLLVIKLHETGFEHSLGCSAVHRMFGMKVITYNHNALRLYYRIRNASVLVGEYLKSDPLFSMALVTGNIRIVCKIILFERNKYRKMVEVIRGIRDSLVGKSGKREQVSYD